MKSNAKVQMVFGQGSDGVQPKFIRVFVRDFLGSMTRVGISEDGTQDQGLGYAQGWKITMYEGLIL